MKGGFLMKKYLKIANIVVPPLLILLLMFLAFNNANDLTSMGLTFNSLMVFYPLIFLFQGIFSALLKSNIYLTITISLLSFVLVIFIWLNSSALGYVLVYAILAVLGFAGTNLIMKWQKR